MVINRSADVFSSFQMPFAAIEDGQQSSEDGSGLHSPTFMDKDTVLDGHHTDFRVPQQDLEIRNNIVGILPSHFSPATTVPTYPSPFHTHIPGDTAHADPYGQSHSDYEQEAGSSYGRMQRVHYLNTAPRISSPPSLFIPGSHGMHDQEHSHPMTLPSLPMTGLGDNRAYRDSEASRDSRTLQSRATESPISPTTPQASELKSPKSENGSSRGASSRREPSLVVIACCQCRARKIKCDSTRPNCNNCIRRSNECVYDNSPKRRGPDKHPGTRKRSCKKRPVDGTLPPPKKKARKGQDDVDEVIGGGGRMNMNLRLDTNFAGGRSPETAGSTPFSGTPRDDASSHFPYPLSATSSAIMSHHVPTTRATESPQSARSKSSFHGGTFPSYDDPGSDTFSEPEAGANSLTRPLPMGLPRAATERVFVSPLPSLDPRPEVWWNELLKEYSPTRDRSQTDIAADLTFLNTNYWIPFINEKLFFRSLWDENGRESIQPALVFAGLALATLMKSSELGHGGPGRARAIWLRDAAQAYLESSWSAGPIDLTLGQAAFLLAVFESSAHPNHSVERASNALSFLDEIIRHLTLTRIDADNPKAAVFDSRRASTLPRASSNEDLDDHFRQTSPSSTLSSEGMSTTQWDKEIDWDPNWSDDEVRAEETRRLCWNALALAAAHTVHCAAFHNDPMDLFVIKPENYAILYPGEKQRSTEHGLSAASQSVWALYCRSMLLWNSCLRLRKGGSDSDKAEFAMQAWLETQEIADCIELHRSSVNDHLVFMTKEHLFNARIAIAYEFRRFVALSDTLQNMDSGNTPSFNRRQAEEWLYYQAQTINRFHARMSDHREVELQLLARRPFVVWWFMSQLTISMSLWEYDTTLSQALDLCKAFLAPLDFLTALWPCEAQRKRYIELRDELSRLCLAAGMPTLAPPDLSLTCLQSP